VASNCTKGQFEKMVIKAKAHIKAGDIFQVVLSQRFKADISVDAFEISNFSKTFGSTDQCP